MSAAGHGLPADTQRFVALQMVPQRGVAAGRTTSRADHGRGRFEDLRGLRQRVQGAVQSREILRGMRGEGAKKGDSEACTRVQSEKKGCKVTL